ncbi:MAG: cyanophycin synthetase [Gammaproteobacteria bacterium]|uniref:cyanophycin synthetase n=1 Tax=Rhodoferax sp. TaxID=50421 RepID=UPI001848A5E8|nr:cyanophycin synthetase [Rhodoferax sp.]MBU3897374.1 cyanophycin synthetase [Gammaproteobacteria bacterium]MBA3058808.1 cyanophycin synthetase [Rhodoferax sp.]MBU3999253.1 cyanophycin synthetase [Gammaproteobacteria bacterium]MBU4018720.1 cyanophycin synthetase [Gammaproteobacteria bacterium]MBU4079675.1 cyanophycin synthetase [Gammaproteobacteria bacterium]
MDVSRIRALRGPNLWSSHTAIEAVVTCTPFECDIGRCDGFESRLRARFPELSTLHATGLAVTVPMAHVLEVAALDMQALAGCPVTFGRTTATPEPGVYQIVVEYSEEAVGRLALELAIALCQAAQHDQAFDLPQALAQLRELDEDVRLGPSTGAIVQAALARNIPYRRMTTGSMVSFGWGSKQRRIQAAEIDSTGAIAEAIAQDKQLTKKILAAAGVPVPQGREVATPEDAWAAACEIGLPVVLKPKSGNQGKGVSVNISSREQLLAAYAAAAEFDDDILVERYLPGNDFRLLVVGNKLVAAAHRDPANVVGDGQHSIEELVAKVNQDPRRGSGHATALTKIRFDDIALACLAAQGFKADTVPPKGQRVPLRHNANLSTGGCATDVTDSVHPEVAARAVAAAQMVGLDICGVDVVCSSILIPLEEQGGGVVEVNAAPGLRMHLSPSYGKGRAVGEAIIDCMFAEKETGRIPLVAVTGTNGKTTTVRLIAHLLGQTGLRVGMTNTDGVYIAGQRIDTGDCSGPKSARNVLQHPDVDAAVLETARGGMLREGLAFDRCDVAVVTNVGSGDHLGLNYITTVEDLAVLKRVIVQNMATDGVAVLNAADPIVVAMARHSRGSVTFFAMDRHHPVMATHLAQGRRGVYVENEHLVAAQGKLKYQVALSCIPVTHNGSIGFQVENVMAAVAAAWALGVTWDTIKQGLASFINDSDNALGRFNLFSYRGATVIADYGHNPDAIAALVQAVQSMPGKRRTVVISGAGDRRDEDIRQQTEILGDAFDNVVLYQDQCQRGRADGEVLALLRAGLAGAKRTQDIAEVQGEFRAIDSAMDSLGEGDLCLILVDQVEQALAHIAARIKQDQG